MGIGRPGKPSPLAIAVVCVVVTVLAFAPATALAQEIGEPPPDEATGAGLELLPQRLEAAEAHPDRTGVMGARPFVWAAGRRFYQWVRGSTSGVTQGPLGRLVAYDLDTFEEVAMTEAGLPIAIPGTGSPVSVLNTPGGVQMLHNPYLAAVDEERGLIYVPAVEAAGVPGSVEDVGGPEARPCAVTQEHIPNQVQGRQCFTGLLVLDAETLEKREVFGFAPAGLDGSTMIRPAAVAVSFSAALGSGRPKVHVVLDERVHEQHGAPSSSLVPHPRNLSQRSRAAVYWVVQFDAESGRVDWATRASACQGDTHKDADKVYAGPWAAVFRNANLARPTIWVACPGPGIDVGFVNALDLDPENPDAPPIAQRRWVGPAQFAGVEIDPVGERLVLTASFATGPQPATAWVFDGRRGMFVGRLDLGYYGRRGVSSGFDPTTGRLYLFGGRQVGTTSARDREGGIAYVDLRRSVVAQPSWIPAYASLTEPPQGATGRAAFQSVPIVVDPAPRDNAARVFVRPAELNDNPHFYVFEDRIPVATDSGEAAQAEDRTATDDVPERSGATSSTFNGDARGYGFRHVQVSGLDGVATLPPDTRDLITRFALRTTLGYHNVCQDSDREFALGMVGPPDPGARARIDAGGNATATARAFHVDSETREDLGAPVTRCGGSGVSRSGVEVVVPSWEELGAEVVRGLDTDNEPGIGSAYEPHEGYEDPFWEVSCTVERPDEQAQDPLLPGAAEVACRDGAISGAGSAGAVAIGPVRIADARSRMEVERRTDGGIVARIASSVTGISIIGEQGAVSIDAVEANAVAWATGRSGQSPADSDDGSSDQAGCGVEETGSGTCYGRSFSGVRVIDSAGDTTFSCGECADRDTQRRMAGAMQDALGTSWIVALREPDEELAAGRDDGTQSGVSKVKDELEADALLKGDQLPTLPALELLRINDSAYGPGRQLFQFAGIETALTYGIQCLLEVVDGECVSEPASLDIELADPFGTALPGGVFEVHEAGEDGLLGLEDLDVDLPEPLVCVTGPDGTCGFDTMQAGTYVVHQSVAPDGYVPMDDQTIDLPAGGRGTLTVVNGALPVTGIAITLTDLDGAPLEGGEFEVHAGETVADDGTPLAACVTDEIGVCQFPTPAVDLVEAPLPLDLLPVVLPDAPDGLLQVPGGGYTVRQTSAPDGFEPVDDIPFVLPEGQIARVALSNAPPWVDDVPGDFVADTGALAGPVAEPVTFAQQPPVAEPVFHVEFPDQPDQPVAAPGDSGDSPAQQFFMLPGDALRFALRHPKEALAFGGVLLLFAAAGAGAYRRRLVLDLLGP
jgi:hypothetical protein